jgi:hypothetical protein
MTGFTVIVERHDDGYVAYPLGLNGVSVAEGEGRRVGTVGRRTDGL